MATRNRNRNPLSQLDAGLTQFLIEFIRQSAEEAQSAANRVPHIHTWTLETAQFNNLRFALNTHRRQLGNLLLAQSSEDAQALGNKIKALIITSEKLSPELSKLTISTAPIHALKSRFQSFLPPQQVIKPLTDILPLDQIPDSPEHPHQSDLEPSPQPSSQPTPQPTPQPTHTSESDALIKSLYTSSE